MTISTPDRRLNRVIRRQDLPQFVGLKRSAVDKLIQDPTSDFPKPMRPTDDGRILCFFEDELIAWQERRRASRDAA